MNERERIKQEWNNEAPFYRLKITGLVAWREHDGMTYLIGRDDEDRCHIIYHGDTAGSEGHATLGPDTAHEQLAKYVRVMFVLYLPDDTLESLIAEAEANDWHEPIGDNG